jgi:L-ascorbate metabolism protein UlaG (beta-lactamase superfamily)
MKSEGILICATIGALVGPPWQTRENGYILRPEGAPSVYIEPHVEFSPKELMKEALVDVVITPIVGQGLPAFDLVHGPQDTIRLLETLRPKLVIPMPNGNVQTEGIISPLVQTIGSTSEFRQRLKDSKLSTTKVMDLSPGQDYIVKI